MTKKVKSNPAGISPFILITAVVIIALVGIIRAGLYQQPPGATPDSAQTQPGSWKRIINPTAVFSSKIFMDRSSTYVGIPIKFDDHLKESWLTLVSSPSAQPSDFLMTHPQLEHLDWTYVHRGVIYLYQRQKQYDSIEDFMANPPPINQVAMDPGIKTLDYYKDVEGYPIDSAFRLEAVNYLLTTYIPPIIMDDGFFYKNFIDASVGIVDSDDNLSWRITVPDTSSASAFYLGQIHIDYNRNK